MEEKLQFQSEKIMAGRMLLIAATHSSTELASFTGWLIAAFGAAFSVLLANIKTVSQFLPPKRLGTAIMFFLFAVVAHVFQRWFAAITAGAAAAAKEAEALGASAEHEIDFRVVFAEVEHATFAPMRWFIRRINARALAGDLAVGGRMQFKLVQLQSVAVFVQLVLAIISAAAVALGLGG